MIPKGGGQNARATGGPGIAQGFGCNQLGYLRFAPVLPETDGITTTDPTINRPLLPNLGFYQQQTFAACCEARGSDRGIPDPFTTVLILKPSRREC